MDIKCVRRLIMIERRSFKVMLEWSTPSISDGDWIRKIIAESGNMGSDVSFANMYLLREKYDGFSFCACIRPPHGFPYIKFPWEALSTMPGLSMPPILKL